MKETYYFQHDYNARNDPKLQEVLVEHGPTGLGVFWCIIEQMYEQGGSLPLRSCKSIAFALHVDTQMVESIVNDFDLFENDDDVFWSPSITKRLNKRTEVSQKRKESALKRWKSTPTPQMQCIDTANAMQDCAKKRKEKERKVKKSKKESLSVSPSFQSGDTAESSSAEPTEREREEFFKIFFFKNYKNPAGQVERFVNHYAANGWTRSNGAKVVDRIALARTWEPKDEAQKGRFPYLFVQFWQSVYLGISNTSHAPTELRRMLYEVKSATGDCDLVVTVTKELAAFLRQYPSIVESNMAKYYPQGRLKFGYYETPRE